jgi:hypothetical protein
MPSAPDFDHRDRGFGRTVGTWLQIADLCDQLPPEVEPEPGWAAEMAESCRALAEILERLATLTPPTSVAELTAWLRTHDPLNDHKEDNEHVSRHRSGRHRLR